ncbi:MAG: hypothetical protein FWC36_07335 [Spirochaetes bacterium]|nr:hypothetical protein [Spirochaetota bacterium]
MSLLQVRDFPQDIYDQIAYEAKRQNRTIAQQTIVLVKKGLGEEISDQESKRLLLKKVRERHIPEHVKEIDFVKLIREDRDR